MGRLLEPPLAGADTLLQSADSRSRPLRPLRHIRSPGRTGSVSADRPSQGSAYPCAILAGRALRGGSSPAGLVHRTAQSPLARFAPPQEESPSWLPLTLPARAVVLRGLTRFSRFPISSTSRRSRSP